MPNYQHGKIYTLRSKLDPSFIYVGSTVQSLSQRINGHKKACRCPKKNSTLVYQTINNNWDNWYIELYELYPCNSVEELKKKEGEIIRLIGNLNMIIAGRTQKEWGIDNKEINAIKDKKYIRNHKEEIKEYQKGWYEENKEVVNTKHKIYRDENKEKIAQHDRERYLTTKRLYLSEEVKCECGCKLQRGQLTRHRKTKKHLDLMEQINNNISLIVE